jgi:hypothetical protein
MGRTRRIVRRSLFAFVIGTTLMLSHASLAAEAKPSDAIGQDPTARYDDGRGASLRFEYIQDRSIYQPYELPLDP